MFPLSLIEDAFRSCTIKWRWPVRQGEGKVISVKTKEKTEGGKERDRGSPERLTRKRV